ncbi:RHS repeat domain-containing protein [Aquidulcibacter paucihalophilus]|uniref:RHS repeat domain-containing protein n=1 Tax=Aquidulcibacter paucihalophilus TaxID=1978549 RepID=UPI000A197366|nr:RHS repeat-associated core domain-containing protein [Aquidulcibacter paucihalophilus]
MDTDILTNGSFDSGTGLPYSLSNVSTFAGDVPDQYRTRLRIQFGTMDVTLWADETAGRQIQANPQSLPARVNSSFLAPPTAGLFLDGVTLATQPLAIATSYTNAPSVPVESGVPGQIILTPIVPFPSAAMRTTFNVAQTFALMNKCCRDENGGFRRNAQILFLSGRQGPGYGESLVNRELTNMHCANACGNGGIYDIIASFLEQNAAAQGLISRLSQSELAPHYLLGVANNDAAGRNWFNLTTAFATTSVTSTADDETAANRTFADTQAMLEGSTTQQQSDAQFMISPFSAGRTTAYTLIRPAAAATAVPLLSIDAASKQRVLDAAGRGLVVVLPTNSAPSQYFPPGVTNTSQFTFSATGFSATIDWIYKGGGSSTQIKPARASEGTLQSRLLEKFGSETYDNGALKLNPSPDISVGSGDAELAFTRSYSSSDVLRQDVEASSRFEWVRGTYAPPPFGPRETVDELPYRGNDSSIKARVGGGWRHNFQGSSSIANSGLKYLNPVIGVDAATAIASLQASVDMARLETLASKVGSIHSVGWLAGKFMANSVSIQAPAGSGTFVMQPSGAFRNQTDRAATLTMTGSRVPVSICQMRNPSATPSDYAGIRISLRGSDGTVSTFEPESSTTITSTSCGPPNSVTYSYSASSTFVLNRIARPSGLVTNFGYEDRTTSTREDSRSQGGISGQFGGDDPSAPTVETQKSKVLISVSTNLGNSLSFQYEAGPDTLGGADSGNFGYLVYNRTTYRMTSVTASDGRVVHFSWPNSNLLTVTRPDGSVLKYDYAPSAAGGDSPQATDPSYRPRYLLRRWYAPRDQATAVQSIKYDELGRVASVTTRNSAGGTSTENVYVGGVFSGETERRVDQVNAAGGTSSAYYDSRGQAVRTVNEVGVAARYEYDGLGRVVTAFFEENAGASFKSGCMAAKGSRSNCWRTEYEYDARGNVTKETKYPYAWEGDYWWGWVEITEAAYSTDFNKPVWVRGPYAADATEADKEAKKTSFEYDARGLLVKITQPVEYDRPAGVWKAGIQEFEYDQYGRLVREKDASGRWTDTGYGENGQPVWCQTSKTRSTQPGGLNLRSTATCTAAGDVATATDAKGNVTTFTYDATRRKTAETAPLGVQKRWIYDLDGNVTTEGAWDGAAWKDVFSTFSPTGKVLTQTDPAGDQVTFTYDALDRVLIKMDPEGRRVLICYNAASQVLEEWRGTGLATSQCGQAVSQASDSTPQRYVKNQYGGPAGAITASWDPNNNQTTYAYQGMGKKITTYWPDGKFEHTLYNSARNDGSVVVTRDREGRWTNSHFDKLGRPWVNYSQETPDVFIGSKIQLNYYDSAGNLNWAGTWNHPDWRIQSSKEYDRDAAGRVYFERTYYSFPMDAAGNVTCWTCDASQVTYEYDANDNRTNMRWYQPDLGTIAKRADYSYDSLNRMTGIAFGDWGGANQGSVNYQYDTLGRRTKVTRGNGTSTDYAYENDGDLDWMRHLFQGGASATVANGNWVGIDYDYDKSGRVTLTSATDSRIMGALPSVGTYGAANNLNQVANVPGRAAMTWSDAGNLKTDGQGTTFTHDGRNRLKRAVKSDGTTLDFLYTVEGYRVESIRNATGATPASLPAGGTRTRFLLSGSEEVADLDANRNFIRFFVPGPAIDERVAQIEANGAVSYMHTDRQASVVAITDAAGNVVSRRGYGSYGETDGAQQVGTGSHPFGYTGRRWDPDLGIYYYRARWYDPTTGTFLQTDPIGSLDYINLYAYVGLEPGNATDPTGMDSFLVYRPVYFNGVEVSKHSFVVVTRSC